MVVNCETKHKSKTILEENGDLVLAMYFTLLLCGKVAFKCNFSARYNTQNTFYIT